MVIILNFQKTSHIDSWEIEMSNFEGLSLYPLRTNGDLFITPMTRNILIKLLIIHHWSNIVLSLLYNNQEKNYSFLSTILAY